ncbi:uncharacterized protein CLAFUR5_13880 [Fulvia fulva]|uniref:Uncharacterized protein n=1 Tax=Passalora fulva TaxID=5499 RepID=A0A9Q8PLB4_PASFU|nr:uncharacterized protein CLAFUR5_13880 [Fulvia fulva]KAK4611030.1 hypothetical protein CLAFUR0_14049 [Fulvia fulva]UJO24621.1 hypothetical protein CLAFUR5_13880 [Fulvia fulva]WPV36648.1 hypothetical protein CLAFUW7_14053 [Fulvia fulva]
MARKDSIASDPYAYAIAKALEYIDAHTNEFDTESSQKKALSTLITTQKLQYADKYSYGLYDVGQYKLWTSLKQAAERHKRSGLNIDITGSNGINEVFKRGSVYFEQNYLITIRSAPKPVGVPPPTTVAVEEVSGRRPSRLPVGQSTASKQESAPRAGRKRSTLRKPVDEDGDREAGGDSKDVLSTASTSNKRQKTTGKPGIETLDKTRHGPTGDYDEDIDTKQNFLTMDDQPKKQPSRPATAKPAADQPSQRTTRNGAQKNAKPAGALKTTSKQSGLRPESLVEIDSDVSDFSLDDDEIQAAQSSDPEIDDIDEVTGNVSDEGEVTEADDNASEGLLDDEEVESSFEVKKSKRNAAAKSATVEEKSAKINIATKPKKRTSPALSDDDDDFDDSVRSEQHSSKKIKSAANRAGTPGPPSRVNGQGTRIEGEEDDFFDEEYEQSDDGDDGSDEQPPPPCSEVDADEDEEEEGSEVDELTDADTSAGRADIEDGRPLLSDSRPDEHQIKPTSPAKRASPNASDVWTPSKRQKKEDHRPHEAALAAVAEQAKTPEHDDTMPPNAPTIQQSASANVMTLEKTGMSSTDLQEAFNNLSKMIDQTSQRFFENIGQTSGRLITIAPSPYPALEAVYRHVLSTEHDYMVVIEEFAFREKFEPSDLLRSMIASQLLTKIFSVDLPWQIAASAPSSTYIAAAVADPRGDNGRPVKRVLWLASQAQINDEHFVATTVEPKAQQLAAGILLTLGEHLHEYTDTSNSARDWHTDMYRQLADACREALIVKSQMVASKLEGDWLWDALDADGNTSYEPQTALMAFPGFSVDTRDGVREEWLIEEDLIGGKSE